MTTLEAKQNLSEDLKNVGRDARQLLSAAAEKAGEKTDQFRARFGTTLESTKAAAKRAQAKTVSAAKATDKCVRNHPYQTITVFFGLGLLAGILLGRRGGSRS
jgi:ElaB/YqjD/DUF883 family membrane-anchored ribosome-binding protein